MARVILTGNLRQYTGDVVEFDLEVSTIAQLLRTLSQMYPQLAPHLEAGIAVAIDGQIFQDALLEQIPPHAEVHILPQIAGG